MSKKVKITTLPNLLDLIAPHSCRGCGQLGNVLCGKCKNYIISQHANLCPVCKSEKSTSKCPNCKSLPEFYIIGRKADLLEALIYDLKYRSVRDIAKPLGEILDAIIPTLKDPVYLVPLPTIRKHVRRRGLDHTLLIAKAFKKTRKNYKIARIITRATNSIQVGANATTRVKQANEAYAISPKKTIDQNATYVLIDDVWTTGASMLSAAKLLKKAGAQKIVCIIIALSISS